MAGRTIQITGRKKLVARDPHAEAELPPVAGGLECVCLIDDRYAATLRFRDQPRAEGASFIHHLGPRHHFDRVMLVTGDRESEARYLAEQVGIEEVLAGQTPEQKLEIVREETRRAKTVFLGDGINDAPALTAATVGIAFGQNSDITAEAAGAVILDSSLAEGRRVPAHQPPAAVDRAAERRRRDGAEPDRHADRRRGLPAAGRRGDRAGGDRRARRAQRACGWRFPRVLD